MRFLFKIFIKITGYALGVLVASSFVPGFTFSGDWRMLLAAGTLLAVVQTVVLPVLKVLTFPLALVTLGVFHVVLSAAVLWAAVLFIPGVHATSFVALAWAVAAIGATGFILSFI